MKQLLATALIAHAMTAAALAETVTVKYRDTPVELKHFECRDTVSSFVHQVCYDNANQYMVIKLRDTRYHYCDIDSATVAELLAADSKGRYYNANIKGRFDCRMRRVPQY